jgi:hypothetical protein
MFDLFSRQPVCETARHCNSRCLFAHQLTNAQKNSRESLFAPVAITASAVSGDCCWLLTLATLSLWLVKLPHADDTRDSIKILSPHTPARNQLIAHYAADYFVLCCGIESCTPKCRSTPAICCAAALRAN